MVSKYRRSELVEMLSAGKNATEIAAHFNISVSYANRRIKAIGGTTRPPGRPNATAKANIGAIYQQVVLLRTMSLSEAANMLSVSPRTLQRRFAEIRNGNSTDRRTDTSPKQNT